MKTTLFIAAFAFVIASCSSETTVTDGTQTETGTDNAEILRLSDEVSEYFRLKTEAAGEMNMEDMNYYGAKMDSVDALYQAALRGQ